MKINLATIFWATTVLCLVAGWMWERRSYNQTIHGQLDAEVRVECAINSALRRNAFSLNLKELEQGKKSPEKFSEFQNRQLVDSLIELFLCESVAREQVLQLQNGTIRTAQTKRILESAGSTLSLLDYSCVEDLEAYFAKDETFFDLFGNQLFDANRKINARFADFIQRAIKYQLAATTGKN